jgi:hypothetical protein
MNNEKLAKYLSHTLYMSFLNYDIQNKKEHI